MAVESGNLCPNCFQISYINSKCSRCGYGAATPPQYELVLPPGTLLDGQYLVGRVLGIGGFGITYLAMHAQSEKLCAIKEYFPTSLVTRNYDSSVSAGRNQENFRYGLRAFLSESETLKSFLGNPLIVQVHNSFQDNGTAYFAMEYLNGVNARALTKKMGGRLPYMLAVEILLRVSDALQQIHRRALLHRDVSPENIFVTESGQVKLIDFGATRFFVGEKSMSLSVVLKPGFAPPEQYSRRGNQGPWTDIYALAASFYFISSGRLIPNAQDRLAGAPIPPLKEIVSGLSPEISEIIDVALRLDYRERFQTIDNFLSVVQTEMSGSAPRNPTAQAPQRSPYLKIISGGFNGNKWTLPVNTEVAVGRSASHCSIVIDDPKISRKHCVIRFDPGKRCFFIKDTSTNGTYNHEGLKFASDSFDALAPDGRFYLSSADFMIMVGLE